MNSFVSKIFLFWIFMHRLSFWSQSFNSWKLCWLTFQILRNRNIANYYLNLEIKSYLIKMSHYATMKCFNQRHFHIFREFHCHVYCTWIHQRNFQIKIKIELCRLDLIRFIFDFVVAFFVVVTIFTSQIVDIFDFSNAYILFFHFLMFNYQMISIFVDAREVSNLHRFTRIINFLNDIFFFGKSSMITRLSLFNCTRKLNHWICKKSWVSKMLCECFLDRIMTLIFENRHRYDQYKELNAINFENC